MFLLYLKKGYVRHFLSLCYKIHSVEKYLDGVREPLDKEVAFLDDVSFILQHFDWFLCIIRNVIG